MCVFCSVAVTEVSAVLTQTIATGVADTSCMRIHPPSRHVQHLQTVARLNAVRDVAGGGHCSYNPTGDVDEEGLCLANVNQNVEVTNIGEVTTTPTEAATTTEPTSTTSAPVDDVTTTAAPAERPQHLPQTMTAPQMTLSATVRAQNSCSLEYGFLVLLRLWLRLLSSCDYFLLEASCSSLDYTQTE